uniref:Putative endodeoxyribonuclease n=1 Tax=viral metagenome TaxID=1070528 RepID=A0A6M3Y1R4_9ZZZZ
MLQLNSALDYAVRIKGEGGPQIMIEMKYLPALSSNRRLTRNRYTGQTVLRGEVSSWMAELGWLVKVLMRIIDVPFKLPVKVVVAGVFKDNRYPDCHNFHKAIGDGIKQGLGIDDKFYVFEDLPPQVVKGCQPKLVITIREAE